MALVELFPPVPNTFNKNAFSPNVDQDWRDKVCIPNAVDCNQNFGIITFSEFSTWGASSYNGTEQPRLSIKDDLTIGKGSHTIKTGFTFDASSRTASVSRTSAAAPVSASGKQPFRVRQRWPEAFNVFKPHYLRRAEHRFQQPQFRSDQQPGNSPRQMQIGMKLYW